MTHDDGVRTTPSDPQAADRLDAFEAVALPFLPEVARFALSLTRSEPDADDLVQDTYLRAYQAWDSFQPGTECRAWLFTICRHSFFRTRRREERFVAADDPAVEALAAAAVHSAARQSGTDDLFARVDLGPAIERAIAELPDAFREAVILVDVQELRYDEAAAVLDVPIGTVRSRLFRARRLLQEALLAHARDAGFAVRADLARSPEAPPPTRSALDPR